jgi:hypothetical protein
MSDLTPESFPRLECFPARGMELYAPWTLLALWPEPTEPDHEDLITWWCEACRCSFLPIDEVRPPRCPLCDAEAELGGLSFL